MLSAVMSQIFLFCPAIQKSDAYRLRPPVDTEAAAVVNSYFLEPVIL